MLQPSNAVLRRPVARGRHVRPARPRIQRPKLNAPTLFIGLAFWFWIWGVSGAFIAVPLLAMLKIFCDHIESLAAVGEFLGQRDDGERRATVRATSGAT